MFDVAAFAEKHAGAYADCFAFDKAVARDRYKKLYDACMRDPVKGESSRTIRLSKQLQAAVDKMLTGERANIPFVPEFSKLTEDTDG